MASMDDNVVISKDQDKKLARAKYMREWRIKNREKNLKYNREYAKNNIDKWKKYRKKDLERRKLKNKESYRDYFRKYRDDNRIVYRISRAKRRAALLLRTPKWANLEKIYFIYAECYRLSKETGIKYEVDHIIPLQGKTVSGLHVHNNLQIITAKENRRKLNTLLPQFL